MLLYLYHSGKYKTKYLHAGFFVCMAAFLMLVTTPVDGVAIEVQQLKPAENSFGENQSALRLRNYFSNELAVTSLYKANRKIYLPYRQNLLFSGNMSTVRKYNFLPLFPSPLEINKRESITDFGMTEMVKLPLIQKDNWSMDINGKISSSKPYLGTNHQRNRWNFKHQIGWNASYHLADGLQASLGFYHYRIVNGTQNKDSSGSHINSGGGVASLRLQF